MPRKKKEEKKDVPAKKREVKTFTATEWAQMKGEDPALFLYWANQQISESEFDDLLKQVRGEN